VGISYGSYCTVLVCAAVFGIWLCLAGWLLAGCIVQYLRRSLARCCWPLRPPHTACGWRGRAAPKKRNRWLWRAHARARNEFARCRWRKFSATVRTICC